MRSVPGFHAADQRMQALLEFAAVDQPGQVVVAGMVLQGGLQQPALGDVAQDADHQFAGIEAYPVHADFNPARLAARRIDLRFETPCLSFKDGAEMLAEQGLGLGQAKQLGNRHAPPMRGEFGFADPEPGGHERVGDMEFHLVADDKNAVVGAVDIGAQQLPLDFGFQARRRGRWWVLRACVHKVRGWDCRSIGFRLSSLSRQSVSLVLPCRKRGFTPGRPVRPDAGRWLRSRRRRDFPRACRRRCRARQSRRA